MMHMIVDGKKMADEVLQDLEMKRAELPRPLSLGIVMAGGDSVIDSYVRIKERAAERLGVSLLREELPAQATDADAVSAIARLADLCDGIIVQLPLPSQLDTEAILSAIPVALDIDGINPTISDEERPVRAPVAEAVALILKKTGVDPAHKRAVVLGEGRLVGKPALHLLQTLGADTSVLTEVKGSLSDLLLADIVVSGVGQSGLLLPHLIKEGVVLIDAGTSEVSGKVSGDAAPECALKASVFTPVPGGVGPIAVAMIFKNLFALAEHQNMKIS